jgi:hypothetical protein
VLYLLFFKHFSPSAHVQGLDEKIYTVNSDAEAKLVFQEAMKPCDLGPLEGPCPRYVVPSSGGRIRFPDYFEDMTDIQDLADYIHSHAAPRQQMARKSSLREMVVFLLLLYWLTNVDGIIIMQWSFVHTN